MSEEEEPQSDGWRVLREEREREFRIDFAPLRRAIRRNEFVSATVELFLGALVGVTKLNLGADEEASSPASAGAPRDDRDGAASKGGTPEGQAP